VMHAAALLLIKRTAVNRHGADYLHRGSGRLVQALVSACQTLETRK